MKKTFVWIALFVIPLWLTAQVSHIEVGKVLNYKQPVAPQGTDNFLFSTFFFSGKSAYNMKGFEIGHMSFPIKSMKYNPAGSAYALLGQNKQKGRVVVYDAWTVGKVIHEFEEITNPTAIAYSTDSRLFFIATSNRELRVYDGKQYNLLHAEDIPLTATNILPSPNGYHLAVTDGQKVVVVNQETAEVRATLNSAEVTDMAFSADGSMFGILSGSGHCTIYDAHTFSPIHQYTNLGEGRSLAFHPEGKYITVLTNENTILFQNLVDEVDSPSMTDEDGGLEYVRYLRDGKRQTYLTYNTGKSIKYKLLRGFSPNYIRMLADELNARMNEWAKKKDGETEMAYKARVNEETRKQQALLFEQEIATRMAMDVIDLSTATLGSYNKEAGLLTMKFDKLPPVYLNVPENEIGYFTNVEDLEFRDVMYGLTRDDKFEMTYAQVYNRKTGKTYEFNNIERHSLDYLFTDDKFVPIELVQLSGLEEVKLEAIMDDVVAKAKKDRLISDHTKIKVNTDVFRDFDANGKKITNCKISFAYTVEGRFSAQEDFPAGKYKIEHSHAAASMLKIVTKAFEKDFAGYIKPGKKVKVRVTGSADALKITGRIPYDGSFGEFENEPYYLNDDMGAITVTQTSGIKNNEQLAFMRAAAVSHYIQNNIPAFQVMSTSFEHHIEVADKAGGEYRRINLEFIFIDAFDHE